MTDPVLDQLAELRHSGERVAMATLVATRGTTPKREGAKMWVGEGGRVLGSVTIGGCVDVRVIEEAERTLAAGRPRLLSMTLGDEDAWALGFTCGGAVDVLVEPVSVSDTTAYEKVRDEVATGPARRDRDRARRAVHADARASGRHAGRIARDRRARPRRSRSRQSRCCARACRAR